MRLVVDTNPMIRALRTPGPARQFFKLAPLSHLLVYHPEQILELRDVDWGWRQIRIQSVVR